MSYSTSSESETEQSLSSASLETTLLQCTVIATVVSGETTDFFRDDASESESSREQWSSPRYLGSPVPAPRTMAQVHGASSRTKADHKPGGAGAVATPGHEPQVRPAAEPPESGSAAPSATDPMKLLSQLAAQFQVQQEQQAGMMHQLMEKMMLLQSPNVTSLPPKVNQPRRTEMNAPQAPSHSTAPPVSTRVHQGPPLSASVRQGPPAFSPPPVSPEERMGGYAGPVSPLPEGRGVSPTTTVSRFRGDGPTQTLQFQLARAGQKLGNMEASVYSSGYTAQQKKVADLLAECERHFRSDHVDMAWEEDLSDQVEEAEALCLQKDAELDIARRVEKDKEARRKDLQSILPKGFGTKFHGEPSTWPAFREQFVHVIASMDQSVSASTIKNMIDCPKLKKSVKSIRTGDEVLAELDKVLGHSF